MPTRRASLAITKKCIILTAAFSVKQNRMDAMFRGATRVLYVTNHGHSGIKRNVGVVNTVTGDDVTVAALCRSGVVFLLIVV